MNPVPPLTTILMKFLLSAGAEQTNYLGHASVFARSLSDIAVRYEMQEGGQMRGHRPRKTGAYSLEYVEDFSRPRTKQMSGHRSPQ